jgi:hypothetical protein
VYESVVAPFSLDYYRVRLVPNQIYSLSASPSAADGRSSASPANSTNWAALPPTFTTDCGETSYRILVTSARAYTLTVGYQATALATACDQCLAGTWELDNNSYLQLAQSIQPQAEPGANFTNTLDSIEGRMEITFDPAAHTFSSAFNGLTLFSTSNIYSNSGELQLSSQIQVNISGGYRGAYSTQQDLLQVTNSGGGGQVDIYRDGALLYVFSFEGADAQTQSYLQTFGAQGGDVHFVCQGDWLSMEPGQPLLDVNPNAPWLQFTRSNPTALLEFSGSYGR